MGNRNGRGGTSSYSPAGGALSADRGVPDMAGTLKIGKRKYFSLDGYKFVGRYVVLRGSHLEIYRDRRHSTPAKRYDVRGSALEVTKGRLDKRSKEFGLRTAEGVTWLWCKAKDEGERHVWERSIYRAIQKFPSPTGTRRDETSEPPLEAKGISLVDTSNVPATKEDTKDSNDHAATKRAESGSNDEMTRDPPSYAILAPAALSRSIDAIVDSTAGDLGVMRESARAILMAVDWNCERLRHDWVDPKLRDAILETAHLKTARIKSADDVADDSKSSSSSSADRKIEADTDTKKTWTTGEEKKSNADNEEATVECAVCWDDVERADAPTLGRCNHPVCTKCWARYLDNQIRQLGNASIGCPVGNCCERVDDAFVRRYCGDNDDKDDGDGSSFQLYLQLIRNDYVSRCEDVRWCPNPNGCGRAVRYQRDTPIDVFCECDHRFCFRCGEAHHEPAMCAYASEWRRIEGSLESIISGRESVVKSDSSWIYEHAKPCPRCKKPIQRNQGCDSMTCRRGAGGCGHEFCWICLQPAANHDASKCSEVIGEARIAKILGRAKRRRESDASKDSVTVTARFEGYYLRYHTHLRAADFASRSRSVLLSIAESHGNGSTVRRIADAARVVEMAHRRLGWVYVQTFFLESETTLHGDLAHSVRVLLEESTERLHGIVESWKEFLKQKPSPSLTVASVERTLADLVLRARADMTRATLTMRWLGGDSIGAMRSLDSNEADEGKDEESNDDNDDDDGDDDEKDRNRLPPGWTRFVDWSSGRAYYYNRGLKKSQWEKPLVVDRGHFLRNRLSFVQAASMMGLLNDSTPWQCPRCTFINGSGGIHCSMCHGLRPVTGSAADSTLGQKWHCKACTFLNEPTSIQCAVCFGTERAEPEKEAKKSDDEENADGGASKTDRDGDDDATSVTAPRNATKDATSDDVDDARAWTCPLCESKNSSSAPTCPVCDTPIASSSAPKYVRALIGGE